MKLENVCDYEDSVSVIQMLFPDMEKKEVYSRAFYFVLFQLVCSDYISSRDVCDFLVRLQFDSNDAVTFLKGKVERNINRKKRNRKKKREWKEPKRGKDGRFAS